jgi:AmmeMemoRadiSam system protein B
MSTPTDAIDPHVKPKLRRGLSAEPVEGGVVLADQVRLGRPVQLTPLGLELARRFDGRRTLRDIQAELMLVTGGVLVPLDVIATLAAGLDEALLLDSPRFAEYVHGPVRKPACIGCYDADPVKLRDQLRRLFTAPGGPGLPEHNGGKPCRSPHGKLRAALLPHMDYARGNVTYGWGFKELAEQTDATVFVVVATSHYSPHRFTLTRKNFETPLGVVETDRAYVDRVEAEYGDGLFEDEPAHLPEHSIELEVVLLQYLFEGRRPFRIVPLLVGSFADCVYLGRHPSGVGDITRMVAALRAAEAACPEPVCYVISGDLAHIGPKFDDDEPVAESFLSESRTQDEAILSRIEAADPAGYFGVVAGEVDRRRICGLPPTYLTLEAIRPRKGRVLHYQQFVHPQGYESVSFAAAAFYS